ncbi:MAG TPA: YfiR family protein [Caldimonas sp.]|jgi:hypothetical protein|nr:YfiR family protein [Caldimonas sp.]HEX2541057.1 YfiR family protein [Caldimonas sp.]
MSGPARSPRPVLDWLLRVALCVGLLVPLHAAGQQASDASVKAAYLYHFLPYVDWPASSLPPFDAPLVIGIAGAEAVRAELQTILVGRHVHGRPVTLRAIADNDPLAGLHAIFIGRDANQPRLLERLRGRPILVITDAQAPEAGSMLNFVPVQGRIRFEASPGAAERSGLKLGARLLAVAERVVAP